MLEKMNRHDFDKVFALMDISFPSDEYRPYEEQKALLTHPRYQIYVVRDEGGNRVKAFLTVWEFDEFVFIEHFAVDPSYRNGGTGSRMLKELFDALDKRICLEVEPPHDEITSRRVGFYERNGFILNSYPYMQPAISKGRHSIPLCIMTSKGAVCEEEFDRIKTLLYTEVYGVL